ncbi:O-methyltransferase-domain-containing protein [Aspergillus minisclerotigenes]|uniref:O-methyltransferase-domain-containing protein n=1 Tax=Aspergillus minisclerotigenes TaxID=656917 RepID=A0A5N6J9S1_9EURO|nr:O-methyltransferase-domain-containing protein [Aspergillus minisclerotigenes]
MNDYIRVNCTELRWPELVCAEPGSNSRGHSPPFHIANASITQLTAIDLLCLIDFSISKIMEPLLQLETALRAVVEEAKRPNAAAAFASLRRADPNNDPALTAVASRVVDLASEVTQLLEPAYLALADHLFGYQHTQCLAAVVELRIPDCLASGPQTFEQLSISSGARRDRLRQVLRLLYNNGVFSYDAETDSVRNNEASEMLKQDHWTQWHRWASVCSKQFYQMAQGLPRAMSDGVTRSPAQVHYDTDESMFSYLERNGTMVQLRECMGAAAIAQTPGMITGYPWAELSNHTLFDLGGGDGSLIAGLLRAIPTLQGGIMDTPRVFPFLQEAFHHPSSKYADVALRIPPERVIAGDFLQEVIPSEAYVMRWCLHDWNDEQACQILRNIRRSIINSPVSRLIILESVLADGRWGRMSRIGDINVMVTAEHGQERTETQWRQLTACTGWKVVSITQLPGAWPSAIDMRPVERPENV